MTDGDGADRLIADYRRYTLWKIGIIAALLLLVIVVGGYAMALGNRDIGLFESYGILFDHICGQTYVPGTEEWYDDYVIWNYRIPRVMGAVVAGFGLALGGVAMQSLTMNPLADPYTTGMSAGAQFGVALAIVLGVSATGLGQYGTALNAFLFGLIPAIIVTTVAGKKGKSPATIILAGVAISYFFSSLGNIVVMRADPEDMRDMFLWQVGTLEEIDWSVLPLMVLIVLAGSVLLMFLSNKLNIMTLGSGNARTMGLDVGTMRIVVLVVLSVVTSVVVSFCGIIGFVGLVAPHIMRLIIGGDNRFVIPAAGLFGGLFLLVADTLGRTVIAPDIIPVGVVMSFVGAPIFLALIIRMKKEVW